MKMVFAVVQDQDANHLVESLLEADFRATKLATTGGFLREGNTTLMIGVEDERLDDVLDIIRDKCHTRKQLVTPMTAVNTFIPRPVEVSVGGATIFVLNIEQFEHI